MQSILPPLRAMHAFESFGRLGSVSAAARELGVTPGAISQQIKLLEEHLRMPLIVKDGRRASLAPKAKAYHAVLSAGFEKLKQAQHLLSQQVADLDVHVSGLPTLVLKWLNPRLHHFEARFGEASIRLEATHVEPDPEFLDHMFRITYGTASRVFHMYAPCFVTRAFPFVRLNSWKTTLMRLILKRSQTSLGSILIGAPHIQRCHDYLTG